MRYRFIAWQVRLQPDERTIGDLFYACCDELASLSFSEALHRLLIFGFDRLQMLGSYCAYTAQAFIDVVMSAATSIIGLPCGFPRWLPTLIPKVEWKFYAPMATAGFCNGISKRWWTGL
jgi:hypothetical protein